jgi:NitT/TauT family transport system permease protein
MLMGLIVVFDQVVWRPLLAWSTRFKLEMVAQGELPSSWFYRALRSSRLVAWWAQVVRLAVARLDRALMPSAPIPTTPPPARRQRAWATYALGALAGGVLLYGVSRAIEMLLRLSVGQWLDIALAVGATFLRVAAALAIALAWTVPLGVVIGTRPRLAAWLQPVVQIAASLPATALFPVILLAVLGLPGGMNLAAVVLMLMGTQWYLLFNVTAGASAIPKDLYDTSALLQLNRWQRWRTLILPALLPYLITGAITASGGAWNASIIAEYFEVGGRTYTLTGVGALIAQATAAGTYPLLLAATLAMIVTVAALNRMVWRRLYRLAEGRYRLE